jgi:hypothetical protein
VSDSLMTTLKAAATALALIAPVTGACAQSANTQTSTRTVRGHTVTVTDTATTTGSTGVKTTTVTTPIGGVQVGVQGQTIYSQPGVGTGGVGDPAQGTQRGSDATTSGAVVVQIPLSRSAAPPAAPAAPPAPPPAPALAPHVGGPEPMPHEPAVRGMDFHDRPGVDDHPDHEPA